MRSGTIRRVVLAARRLSGNSGRRRGLFALMRTMRAKKPLSPRMPSAGVFVVRSFFATGTTDKDDKTASKSFDIVETYRTTGGSGIDMDGYRKPQGVFSLRMN